jgi:hypothetical protein
MTGTCRGKMRADSPTHFIHTIQGTAMDNLNKFLFIPAALDIIARPDFFRRVCAWTVRVFGALFALGAVIGWFQLWKAVFELNGAGILGGVLFQVFFVIGVYMVLHILWLRAAAMETQTDNDFVLLPLEIIFLRMTGEIYASIAITAGLGRGVLQLFVDHGRLVDNISSTIPGIGWEHGALRHLLGGNEGISSFLNALLFMLGGVVSAALWLVVFYLLAEFVSLLLGMARDLRKR